MPLVTPPEGWTGAEILFLDCDSTLVTVEGVDEMAAHKGIDVAALTAAAMEGGIPLEQVYRQRLKRIAPTAADLAWTAARYRSCVVPGAAALIQAAQGAGVAVHILSGGLRPAILPLAQDLGLKAERVHAVPFDSALPLAQAIDQACEHPLAREGGKPAVIEQIAGTLGIPRARRMLIGDGASDLEAASVVGLFVAFGGVVDRPQVRAGAHLHWARPDLSPLADLAIAPPLPQDS